MTVWAPARLADFASSAGFTGDAVAEAVALALTVSGGDDQFLWSDPTTHAVIALGLYGLTPALVVDYPPLGLTDPRGNTAAAYAMWKAHGRTFSWSKAYGTAAYDANIGTARSVSSALGRSVTTAPAAPYGDAPGLAKSVAQGGRRAVAFLQDAGAALRRLP